MPPYRGKSSLVWNHFTEVEAQTKAKCNHCAAVLSICGGSLGNLKRHMKSKHFTIPLERNEITEYVQNENIDDPSNIDQSGPSTSNGISRRPAIYSRPGPSTASIISRPGPSTANIVSGPVINQTSIVNYVNQTRPMSVDRQKQIDNQLIKMIVKGYYPFDIVEDKEFHKLLEMLNPTYKLPSRKTVSNSLIPRLYNLTQGNVKTDLDEAFAVCLTTDGWTSIKNESFLAITAHFIKNDLMKSVCLGCEHFEERNTINNLASFLNSTIQKWNVQNKIVGIVSDNAPNIVGAIKQIKFRHLSCFAHNVNLVVQHGIKEIDDIKKKIKCIVEYFKRSSYAQTKLLAVQKQMGLPELKLKQDVVTQWNSTHDMFKRILVVKDAVVSTLAILESEIDPMTPAEWKIVQHASDVLQIFAEVTTEISSERYVSFSKVLLFIRAMIDAMGNFKKDSTLPLPIVNMVSTIYTKLNLRFSGYEENELINQAALLDPRFKKLAFSGFNPRKLEIALEQLKIKVCQVVISESDVIEQPNEAPPSNVLGSSKSLLWKHFDEQYSQSACQNPTSVGIIEFDKYMREPLISRHEDPLKWWKIHKDIYPRLYIMVKKRLCVPATSVPCERLLSKAGMVITDRRNRMLASKSSKVLFLNENL